uniref:pseudouridine synthase n=1 Tax=Eubacterium cellulosolvens TaxID=29322 RepID=UPI0004800110|nr:pseudouridine synthase [[Eubacterium] cellulosolvens]
MRINKYLSASGLCSRREADRLVEAGHVSINGEIAEPGSQADGNSIVTVRGKRVTLEEKKVYLKMYKPVGIVCTAEKRERDNLIEYINYPVRVTYAGRLDRNSEGLLILTNDGDLIQTMMAARNAHEKEYEVTVNKDLRKEDLDQMRAGVFLRELEVTTRPCTIVQTGERTFRIILTQGLNRQIRRMCKEFSYGVRKLKRIRVVNITLDGLKYGKLQEMSEQEVCELKAALGMKEKQR